LESIKASDENQTYEKSIHDQLEISSSRQKSQDDINRKHEGQVIKHKELMDRRKQYGFYRSSITSQLKQHQIIPTEFGKN
jgi:hypothetical protein